MKRLMLSLALLIIMAAEARAVPISIFTNTEKFVSRADEIVIAKCIGPKADRFSADDGLCVVDVDVVKVLKGSSKPGKSKIVTIYTMQPGETYMLTRQGDGLYKGVHFFATPELSVVELPSRFSLKRLEGKKLVDQVESVFEARRSELERQLSQLIAEKGLLEKAVPKKAVAK